MYSLRRFRSTMTGNHFFKESYINKMIVRKPELKPRNYAPKAKLIYNEMIKEPLPLTFKLQEIPENHNFNIPLGNTSLLPFQISRTHTRNLPVYTEFRDGRQKKITIVRRVSGDVDVKLF